MNSDLRSSRGALRHSCDFLLRLPGSTWNTEQAEEKLLSGTLGETRVIKNQTSYFGLALSLFACFALSACVSQVDQDIGYRPAASSAGKRPTHIAVVSDPTLEAQGFKLNPGLSAALQNGLSRAFDPVTVIDSASPPASDVDLIATPSVQMSAPTAEVPLQKILMSVSFAEPGSKQVVATIEYSAAYDQAQSKSTGGDMAGLAILTGLSLGFLSPITVPVMVHETNSANVKDLDHNLVLSVEGISDRAAQDPQLLRYTTHRILQAAEEQEHAGDQALAGGDPGEALADYVRALNSTPYGLPADLDFRIRKSAIAAAAAMNPPPELTEEYRRQLVLGIDAIQEAKSPADYKPAAEYFVKASDVAPWEPQPYYNLGTVLHKADVYDGAARYLKLYLLTRPDAPNARQVQDEIYILEEKGHSPSVPQAVSVIQTDPPTP